MSEDIPDDYILPNDKGPDVTFTGSFIGSVSSETYKHNNRWLIYDCYKTESGKYIVHKGGYSNNQNEVTRNTIIVAESESELIEKVGYNRLEKELYALYDIIPTQNIE